MSYIPEEPAKRSADPDDKTPKKPSSGRIAIWVGVAAVGLYFLISGIYGIVTGGH
ncbi:hypothetical protein [Subtercola lobariae]|uniref:Uncharacterized protein n=1 Tax=Subtercola lobariae TaxID=1588641 RepID=A0A917B7Z4_9MICO|nr:hypothetical protein [Subtercola lobariae]GGF28717.1 hypothetical protein GCM10011399_22340 [Subtercola lobariae]